jgi:hypothetical protein
MRPLPIVFSNPSPESFLAKRFSFCPPCGGTLTITILSTFSSHREKFQKTIKQELLSHAKSFENLVLLEREKELSKIFVSGYNALETCTRTKA